MKNITLTSTYSDVFRSFNGLKDRLFNEGLKEIEFDFLDKHCKMEYVSGTRWNNLCLKYTMGNNFEFHSHNVYMFWLYLVLKRNNSRLVDFFEYYHLEDTDIVLWSELSVFAYYSYVLGPDYDDLLRKGDYEDRNDERKELVLNTCAVLKKIWKLHGPL